MADDEIIKGFEYCCMEKPRPNCKECPIEGACANCDLDYEVLSLINRQKAEIERLNEKITAKYESNYYFMGQLRLAREKLLTTKSEAIKEFVERLKEKYGTDSCIVIINNNDIDELVKEMTEVQE